ncbi:MAG: hypothetical protein EOP74_01445, partial [Variovorax sp.]
PFVGWIWGGCLLMALGGLLAVADRRYRSLHRTAQEPRPVPSAGLPLVLDIPAIGATR